MIENWNDFLNVVNYNGGPFKFTAKTLSGCTICYVLAIYFLTL